MAVIAPYVHLMPGGMLNYMPWTVETYDEAAVAYAPPDGIIYQVMQEACSEVGLYYLWACPSGTYGIGNTMRPLKTPDDFKNWKFRVSGSLAFVKTMENMGAGSGMTLEQIAWSEIYGALERGVLDGCWATWSYLTSDRLIEVLPYYTDLGFGWDDVFVMINKELYEGLPKDLQDAIFKAGRMAEERDYEAHRRVTQSLKEQARAAGVEIYTPTAAEREVFRKKANMPEIWAELATPWLDEHYPGQNMTQKMLDELDRIKASVN